MREMIRMTYCHPEQVHQGRGEDGKPVIERIPNHPTRPARAHEFNTWLEPREETSSDRH